MTTGRAYLDANAIIYFLFGKPEGYSDKVRDYIDQSAHGQHELRLASLTMAEVVWVLESSFELSRGQLASVLLDFISLPGITADEPEALADALIDYRDLQVDFVDAYLAAHAQSRGITHVLTFDRHFARLDVDVLLE